MADELLNGAAEAAPSDGIRAFDQEGREVVVPREQWRTQILPGMLQESLDHPEQLYMLILNSLNDGFVVEVAGAAEHLYRTDPVVARGACMWSIVLIQSGRLDEAEAVLTGYGAQHGEDGSVLTNLAKVYDAKGEKEQAEVTLWHALEVEPNLDNGLGWFVAEAQEKGGEAGAKDALARVAALPGAWRALLWQARYALQAGDLAGAKELYRQALERVLAMGLSAVPGDFLMQMSGDLGGTGHLAELVELTGPHFVPEMHGLPVGNNLIKANFDLGRLYAARAIVSALNGFQRPEWKQPLGFWEQEIGKARAALGNGTAEVQIGMLRIDGPVWLPVGSPGWNFFGAKPGSDVAVTFLGGTAEAPKENPGLPAIDAMGRMTRSLPLFLAEQVEMRTAAHGRAMLPWATGRQSGFVISSVAWTDDQAVQAVAAPGGDVSPSTYTVSVHLDASVEPWTAELAFVRVSDGVRIGEMLREFASDAPEDGLPELADEVVELLSAVAPGAGAEGARYVVPGGAAFGGYLLRLEQLLAVRCASMEVGGQPVAANFLNGEREILEGELTLCQEMPENVTARLLLMETMAAMSRVRPEVVEEFRERVEQLMVQRPLPV